MCQTVSEYCLQSNKFSRVILFAVIIMAYMNIETYGDYYITVVKSREVAGRRLTYRSYV